MKLQTSDLAPSDLSACPWDIAGLANFDPAEHADTADDDRPPPPLWMYDFHSEGNLIRFTRPAVSSFKDATVIGDLEEPEVDALLSMPTVVGLTGRAPRVSGDSWTRLEAPWREIIREWLSEHPETVNKGGRAIFFATSDVTGKKRNGAVMCYKLKDRVRRVHAVAIDVDGGCTVESVIARIRALGLFAIIYTTHSHTIKGGVGSDRFRVILLLAEPFEMHVDGETRQNRAAEWEARYVGLCQALIPDGGDWDFSASRPSQLMYAPARPKGAAFKHYIVAGVGVDLAQFALADVSAYRKHAPTGSARGAAYDGEPAYLSDGFDLMAWHRDHRENFLLQSFLEWIGWDVGSVAGDGFDITCPNAADHSPGTGESAWAIEGPEAKNGAAVFCHHDHCRDLRTWDFLRLVGENGSLPEGFATMSALVCDPSLYPDHVVAFDPYDYGVLRPVSRLASADDVLSAVAEIGELDDVGRAALCAGVILGKNKDSAKAELDKVLGGNAKSREGHWKAGEAHLAKWRVAQKVKLVVEPANAFVLSLDPSDPLGEGQRQKLATLSARFRLVNYKGKTLVVRNVDRSGIEMGDSILEFWTKDSLKQFYGHEIWPEGEGKDVKWINPVDRWWSEEAKRHTRVVFDPSERRRPNDVNLYDADKLSLLPVKGDAEPIKTFILEIICNGDAKLNTWVTLYLAHLVQRPWERPGTAIVMYGKGGAGKGTFGQIVRRLVEPYDMMATDPGHLVGQFAGPSLATSLVVVSEEAVYAKDPAIADKLKGMITQRDMQVEAKGVQSVQMDVYFRVVIDSNHDSAVRIEGNNSERRYCVTYVSDKMVGQEKEFAELYAHINGPAMQAFLFDLLAYDPADAGGWNAVRTAPSTVYRKRMFVESMRASDKAFLRMLDDGEFVWREGVQTFRIILDPNTENRIPARALDNWVTSLAGKYDSDLRPAAAVWKRIFGEELANPKPARASGERQTLEGENTNSMSSTASEYLWMPFGFNTSMYHLPALGVIRSKIGERTGLAGGEGSASSFPVEIEAE